MTLSSGPRAIVIATFVALTLGFLAGYSLAPRDAPPEDASAAPHAIGSEEYAQLGMQSLERGDFASAERYLRRAADISPEDAGAHADLAVALIYQRRWQEAHGELARAEQLSPDTPEIYLLQGVVYRDGLRDPAQARAAWERFLAMVPAGTAQADTVEQWLAGLESDGGEVPR
ncbi:MAG TPA: tetratricopeptide repeat protein [Gemmatimonadota bacterium]|nr:tetratricopeptide repeat protein [Gemmatimonadota bacterium]